MDLVVIGFCCNDCWYDLLDNTDFYGDFYGVKYSSALVPIYVPCMSIVYLRHICRSWTRAQTASS